TGRLGDSLRRILREDRAVTSRDAATKAFYLAYPLVMSMAVAGLIAAIGILIMPKYRAICQDFRIPLPLVTRVTYQFSTWAGPSIFVVVLLLVWIVSARTLWEIFAGRRSESPAGVRLGQRFLWLFPVTRGVLRDRALADACEAMADAMDGGQSLDVAL